MMRTPEQIKEEVKVLARLFSLSGCSSYSIKKSIRFYVTPDEADLVKKHLEDRMIVGGTGIGTGSYLGFYGIRFVTQEGLYFVW